ncbi:MAG TPA: pyridoxamine 5'-phosphate oxidase [Bacteroidales bacterium]|nr:pyridoxamine 5'-phosphate oxidase [Bacteroidales bacterium]HNV95534.1 pyridoxamine 5'-phosphate oxidase [Bacteroidales bacterium]HOU99332.1 pyridoxamine 5'-phosphate oxidase [Bacteroidales bacterium]
MYDLSDFRKNYSGKSLELEFLPSNPFDLFGIWFDDAVKNEEGEVNAVVISTVDALNKPHSRVVLLKEFSSKGFVFFTNYLSAKGKQLSNNPHISLLFFWQKLQRQVRIEGQVQKVSTRQSDEYFYSRPVESQFGAMASKQSEPLNNKKELLNYFEQLKNENKPKRPKHWGGYIVKPEYFEFWQGQPNRLHDRVVYKFEQTWKKHLLYP